jgi:hypothetical protein
VVTGAQVRGILMAWEWEYHSNPQRWTLTVGEWHAIVQRVAGSQYAWQATIERTVAPHDRYTGSNYKDAVDARTWCLTKIATLRSQAAHGSQDVR